MSGSGSDGYRENEQEKVDHEVKVAEARKVVNEVVKALEKPDKPYKYRWLSPGRLTINEVYEGGSLGKGTTVPYTFDVDLVIRSQDITVEMLESSLHGPSNIKHILEDLKMYLQEQISKSYIITIKHTWPRSISFVVAFHDNKEVGVDLLIAPYYKTLNEALDTMRDLKKRHEDEWDKYRILLTPAVTSWQTEYIAKGQPNRVKELIKRLKKWKKEEKWEHGGPPSSYLLEILMIMACEMYCTKQGRTVKDLDHYQKITDIAIGVQDEITAMVKGYKNLRLKPTPCEGNVWTSGPGRWDSCDVASESAANEYKCGDNSLPVVTPEAFQYMNRTLPRSHSCPDLRRRLHVDHYDPFTIDYYLPNLQRSEESSVSELTSLVSVHQEENKFRGATILVLTNSKANMSDTSYDCDTSSVSSMIAVEDTHGPPLNNVIFHRKGVVIEECSERIRQDPVGGE